MNEPFLLKALVQGLGLRKENKELYIDLQPESI